MYLQNIKDILIEQNIFDHNGWNEDVSGAEATIFNHNVYMQGDNTGNIVIRGNIFAYASSHGIQARGGGEITGNLFVQNSISLYISNPNGLVYGNVLLEGKDIDSSNRRAFGIDVNLEYASGVDGALFITNNIIAHDASGGSQQHAVSLTDVVDATVSNNIIYQWGTGEIIDDGVGTTLSGNVVDGTGYSAATRSVGGYNGSIGGTSTLAAFLIDAEARGVKAWDEDYSAGAVIAYIADGFDADLSPVGVVGQGSVSIPSGTISGTINDAATASFTLQLNTDTPGAVTGSVNISSDDVISPFTIELTAQVGALPPSNLVATPAGTSQINLAWTDNSSNEEGFVVQCADDSGFTTNVSYLYTLSGVTVASETGLTVGTHRYYRVAAYTGTNFPPTDGDDTDTITLSIGGVVKTLTWSSTNHWASGLIGLLWTGTSGAELTLSTILFNYTYSIATGIWTKVSGVTTAIVPDTTNASDYSSSANATTSAAAAEDSPSMAPVLSCEEFGFGLAE